MVLICGIDEAGRGPVIGPLIIVGVLIQKEKEPLFKERGVKDSKLLSHKKRCELAEFIKRNADDYCIIEIGAQEIDAAVDGENKSYNLNWLEADKAIEIIKKLEPDAAIIDCPSPNTKKYKAYIQERVGDDIQLIVEHKADVHYVACSAASILAKCRREEIVEELKKKYGDLGSLPYEEKVWIQDDLLRTKNIGEIVETKAAGKVFTFNRKSLRVEQHPITFGFKHRKMEVYEVHFNTGFTLSLSPNHSVFTLSENARLTEKALYELQQGERVAFSFIEKNDHTAIKYIDLLPLLKAYSRKKSPLYLMPKKVGDTIKKIELEKLKKIIKKHKYNRTCIYGWEKHSEIPLDVLDEEVFATLSRGKIKSRNGRGIPSKFPITNEFCWFIGIYLAEGCTIGDYVVSLSNKDRTIRERIIRFLKRYHFGFHKTSEEIRAHSILLNKIIKALNLGENAYEKQIPAIFYNFSKSNLCALLNGIYMGDGYNDGNSQEIEIYSKKLRDGIVNLELLLGNVCSLRYRKKRGSYIARRLSKSTNSLSIDNLPSAIGCYIKKLREKRGLSLREVERNYKISRRVLTKLERQVVECVSKKTIEKINNKIFRDVKLRELLRSTLYWLKIEKIISNKSKETVYDLEVRPSNFQNFIGQGGIILHNSGYGTDPITQKFLKENWEKHPELFRKSWSSWKNHHNDKKQMKLDEFEY